RIPALSPGPLASTCWAVSFPACSTHQTPSSGTWNSRSFWKLTTAKTTAAAVSSMRKAAVNRTWKSLVMDPEGEFANGAELLVLGLCTFGATARDIGRLLSGFRTITSLIIVGIGGSSYGFWKVTLGFGK